MSVLFTPTVGMAYLFTFEHGFTNTNGIYRLVKLMTYDEYLADGGDILKDFYIPNEKTEEDLESDIDRIRDTKIMKLGGPDGNVDSIIHAPISHLVSTPDHNVRKYCRLGLIVNIGITEDPELLQFVPESIKEHVIAATGIDTDPYLVSIADVWLTESQYKEELLKREEDKKKVINYYSENISLRKQIAQLKTRLTEYEKYLIDLGGK